MGARFHVKVGGTLTFLSTLSLLACGGANAVLDDSNQSLTSIRAAESGGDGEAKDAKELKRSHSRPRCVGGTAPEACLQGEVREGLGKMISRRNPQLLQCFRPVYKRWSNANGSKRGGAKADGNADNEKLRQAMEAAFYAHEPSGPRRLKIHVKLELTVSGKARTTEVKVVDYRSPEGDDQRFKTCIVRQIKNQTINPGPEGGSIVYQIPLTFSAS